MGYTDTLNECLVNHSTYSPLAASLAAYFVCQIATFIQMDVSSNTLSAAHLENKVMVRSYMYLKIQTIVWKDIAQVKSQGLFL